MTSTLSIPPLSGGQKLVFYFFDSPLRKTKWVCLTILSTRLDCLRVLDLFINEPSVTRLCRPCQSKKDTYRLDFWESLRSRLRAFGDTFRSCPSRSDPTRPPDPPVLRTRFSVTLDLSSRRVRQVSSCQHLQWQGNKWRKNHVRRDRGVDT